MTTRSAPLAVGTLVGRPSGVVYTCPLGKVTVVKSVHVQVSVAQTAPFYFSVYRPDAATAVIVHAFTLGTLKEATWEGWLALDGLDQLAFGWDSGSLGYWISGAILPGRPP